MKGFFWVLALAFSSCATASLTPQDLSKEFVILGNGYFELKKYKEAAKFFLRAQELDPGSVHGNYGLARTMTEAGEYEAALNILESLLAQEPDNLVLIRTKAYILYLQGKKVQALEIWQGVLNRAPADPESLFNAGIAASDLGQDENALKYLEKYRQIGGPSPDALKVLGTVYSRLKDPVAAAQALEEITASGGSYESFLKLAQIREQQKVFDKAIMYYEKALTLSPEGKKDPKVLFQYGSMLALQIQDVKKALEIFGQALDAGFKDPKAAEDILKSPGLIQADKYTALFKEKKLLVDPAPANPPNQPTEVKKP